ncbi:class I SAM-dependent methyltransferase [Tepidimonas sp.]|uniref:class I SAM-dependent methyltransferase n=1 Tax=Tepidimonas sp. TaxID=2002775 RepID=UPI002FE03684
MTRPPSPRRVPAGPLPEVLAELHPGQSIALLQELHILTRDGRLNQDSRRKLKQVNHLLQFIEPLLQAAVAERGDVTMVDHGAGKSYLGFLLYDRFFAARPVGAVWGVEARPDLVERSAALAQRLGFARMHFVAATVRAAMAALPAQVDVVTALHACDTATDDAIDFALQRRAGAIVVVPCCQAEVAAALRRHKALQLARTPLAELWRHPLHTREFGSQVTNVLRCLRLEASGYDVTVTELVGWEHSMKNELIVARRTGRRKRSAAERLARMLDELGLGELRARFAVA